VTASIRTTPARLARLDAALSDRDRQVLETVASLRLACTRQLQRLYFTGGTPRSNLRSAQRVLGKLAELRLLSRLERRVGGLRAGSAGHVYALGTAGQHLAGGRGPAGGRLVRRPWTPALPFLRHRLAISELYVRLVEASRLGEVELVGFVAEPGSWRRYHGPHGSVSWLKPDAFVTTVSGDYEDRWFVEVDLATESPLVLGRKCQAYLGYQSSGREQAAHGVFPLVLFVVPGERRLKVVEGVIGRQTPRDRRLFRVTTEPEAVATLAGGAA